MLRHFLRMLAVLFAMLTLPLAAHSGSTVDIAALANEKDGANWSAFSRTFSEQRYSPLTRINTQTKPI